MPSNKQRLIGAIASIGITVGGAWLASQLSSTYSVTSNRTSQDGRSTTAGAPSNTTQLIEVVAIKPEPTLIASNTPINGQLGVTPPMT